MNLQESINKIKALFQSHNLPLEVTEVKQKFETAKLNDGVTEIEWEGDMQTGTIVFVIDSQGGKLPLPVGQYQLEDGSTFEIVDEVGTADNVVLTAAPQGENPAQVESAPATAPEMSQAPVAQPKSVIKSQIEEHRFDAQKEIETLRSSMEAKLAEVNEKFEAIAKENVSLKADLDKSKELNKETFAIINQIADEPSKQPTEQKQVFSVKEFRQSWKDGIKELEAKMQKDI